MKRIENKILKNKEKIVALVNNNMDLEYELMLKQAKRFEECEVQIGTKKNPKKVPAKMMYWYEWFKDDDRPNERGVRIERKQLIEIDGKRSFGYTVLEHLTIDNLLI